MQVPQIGVVLNAVRQADIEIRRDFAEWKVLLGVQAEHKDRWVGGQDRGVAVSLMHVQIDDGDAGCQRFGKRGHGGQREIVERAKAGAEIGMGVMRAAGELP